MLRLLSRLALPLPRPPRARLRLEMENTLVLEQGINSKETFYAEISRVLKLANWFGNNLDALNDALRGGCGEVDPEGKTFVWKGHAAAKAALGEAFFDTVMEIFGDDNESGHEAFVVELQ